MSFDTPSGLATSLLLPVASTFVSAQQAAWTALRKPAPLARCTSLSFAFPDLALFSSPGNAARDNAKFTDSFPTLSFRDWPSSKQATKQRHCNDTPSLASPITSKQQAATTTQEQTCRRRVDLMYDTWCCSIVLKHVQNRVSGLKEVVHHMNINS